MTERRGGARELSVDELKRATVSGIRWTALARGVSEAISVAAAVILARLIAPAEFGRAVVPLILVPLAVILTFEGFGSALVQRKSIERAQVDAAMLAGTVLGAVLSIGTFVLARPVGGELFGAAVGGLLELISPLFVLAGLCTVSRARLWRRLAFQRISLIDTASLALGAIVSVALAERGLGAKALVLGALAAELGTCVMLLASARPTLPRWDGAALRGIVDFGLPASAAGLTYVALKNVTLAITAMRLSAGQVGLYWRAFQIGVVYQEKIGSVMLQLSFPVYSRTGDIDELRSFHERATRIHGAALLPLQSLLIVLAPDLVPWLFGPQWSGAVGAVRVLAVAGMIAAVLTGYPSVLLATGRPRALFAFNLTVLGLYAVASWIVAPYGLIPLSSTVVGLYVLTFFVVYAVLFRRLLGIPVREMVGDVVPAVVGCVCLLAVSLPLVSVSHRLRLPVPALLPLVSAAGLLTYALVLWKAFPRVWSDCARVMRRVVPGGGRLGSMRRRRAGRMRALTGRS